MIYEPDFDGGIRNYGYALHEVLLDAGQHKDWSEDQDYLFFPRGTVISDSSALLALEDGMTPVFVGCGWTGEDLDPNLMQESLFVGCRGPKTQDELARCGVDVPITHDPIYDLPRLVPAGAPSGFAMGIIHIEDDFDYSQRDLYDLKSDTLDTPLTGSRKEVLKLVERVSGARFVLSGSLAVAMTAHAYGIPFAALDTGFIHCEPKWEDWFAAEGFGDPIFCSNVIEGRAWYNRVFRDRSEWSEDE